MTTRVENIEILKTMKILKQIYVHFDPKPWTERLEDA
jgi:hypothetical protein